MRKNIVDRRTGNDRRTGYNPAVVDEVGERRLFSERRVDVEKRTDWVRVVPFVSVCMGVVS